MQVPVPSYIVGHKLLVDAYDYWPSFHDAEVISVTLDRSRILFGPIYNARIEIVIHCFEMSNNEVAGFSLVKHNLVYFEFQSVNEVSLSGFNHQNAIYELILKELPLDKSGNHSFKVILKPAFGIGGEFVSSKGEIRSVIPCDKDGCPITKV